MRGNVLTQKFIKGNGPSLGIHSGGPSPCGQRTPCKPTTQTLPQPASGKGRGERGDPRAHTFPLSAAPFGHRETPTTGEARGALLGGALPTRARAQNSASLAETPDRGPAPRTGNAAATTGPGRTAGTGRPLAAAPARSRPNSHPAPCPPASPRVTERSRKTKQGRLGGPTWLRQCQRESPGPLCSLPGGGRNRLCRSPSPALKQRPPPLPHLGVSSSSLGVGTAGTGAGIRVPQRWLHPGEGWDRLRRFQVPEGAGRGGLGKV